MEDWHVGIANTYQESQKTGKPILVNFTGSDWCGFCVHLKKKVFSQEEFKTWAKENVVLYEVDFPKYFRIPEEIKAENTILMEYFNVQGYPSIWLMNLIKKDGEYDIEPLGKINHNAFETASIINQVNTIVKK